MRQRDCRGYKPANSLSVSLKTHTQINMEEILYECIICGKHFTSDQLDPHLKVCIDS